MATSSKVRCRSYNDTDDESDYGFDLTAEEEQLLDSLIARAAETSPDSKSTKRKQPTETLQSSRASVVHRPPAAIVASNFSPPQRPSGAPATGSALSPESIIAPFADLTSVSELPIYRHGSPDALPRLVDYLGKSPSTVGHTNDWAAPAAAVSDARTNNRSIPEPETAWDVRYPDLGRALYDLQDHGQTIRNEDREGESDDEYGYKDIESPVSRFRSFPKKPFSVSDLVAGAWCELQYYYTLSKLPGGKKTRTAAMKGGSKLHKGLEDEVYKTVRIDVVKKEDAFGLRLWNLVQGLRTLRDAGMTRELEVWGLVEGYVVNGVIDHLSYENPDPDFEEEIRGRQSKDQPRITGFFHSSSKTDHNQIYLTDVKTTGLRRPPSGAAVRPAKIQLFLYHRFLSDMAAGRLDFSRILARYGLNPDEDFSDTFMAQIGSLHDEVFQDAPNEPTLASSEKNPGSDPNSRSPVSSPGRSSSAVPDLIRYRTLGQLVLLVQSELALTFPYGAETLGSLVTVEYRKRPRGVAEGLEDGTDEEAGMVIGTNVFSVDHGVLQDYIKYDLEWWQGERDPRGVDIEDAAYKCRSCEFADGCEWRRDQDAEMLTKAQEKIARRAVRKDAR